MDTGDAKIVDVSSKIFADEERCSTYLGVWILKYVVRQGGTGWRALGQMTSKRGQRGEALRGCWAVAESRPDWIDVTRSDASKEIFEDEANYKADSQMHGGIGHRGAGRYAPMEGFPHLHA